jgi:hypothetical protein
LENPSYGREKCALMPSGSGVVVTPGAMPTLIVGMLGAIGIPMKVSALGRPAAAAEHMPTTTVGMAPA